MNHNENIELRSEKVRNIIGIIPPIIIRYGIGIIISVLILLISAAFFIPYPKNLNIDIIILSDKKSYNFYAEAYIPYSVISQIKKGMPVQIEIEGYNAHEYGYINGMVRTIDDNIVIIKNENYFVITVEIDVSSNNRYYLKEKMKGTAFVLITNESFIKYCLNKHKK
jgi:hypothetical protein